MTVLIVTGIVLVFVIILTLLSTARSPASIRSEISDIYARRDAVNAQMYHVTRIMLCQVRQRMRTARRRIHA
jgi:hypothetical protein